MALRVTRPQKIADQSLMRKMTVQRICGQVFVWLGLIVLVDSLCKFISAFWLGASPWPELQLGVAGLILVAA